MKKIIEIITFVQFVKKNIECDKIRDHCQLTGKYRGLAHSGCNNNVTQKQSSFIPFIFHIFSKYVCHLFFKTIVDKKNDKVKFDIIPKTNKKYLSVTYGSIRFFYSYRFLSSSLDKIVKTLVDSSHKTMKDLEDEVVHNDDILKIFSELKILIQEDRYNINSIKDLKEDYTIEIENVEEALLIYIGENDIKILKTKFPDKRKNLTEKLASI